MLRLHKIARSGKTSLVDRFINPTKEEKEGHRELEEDGSLSSPWRLKMERFEQHYSGTLYMKNWKNRIEKVFSWEQGTFEDDFSFCPEWDVLVPLRVTILDWKTNHNLKLLFDNGPWEPKKHVDM